MKDLASAGAQMRTLQPNNPEQQNQSDCGIYLLHYVEKVFENVSAFLWKYRTREWFSREEVGRKRGEIAELIQRLAVEQKPGEEIEYPPIKFTEQEDTLKPEETEAEIKNTLDTLISKETEAKIVSKETIAEIGMNTWKQQFLISTNLSTTDDYNRLLLQIQLLPEIY